MLHRDDYICQHCKNKNKNVHLEVHHIVFRSDNGSDEPDNLITLCKKCHDDLHKGLIKLKGGKLKSNLKHSTQMNSIRVQLLKRLSCEETFGFITKEHRQLMCLPKEHYMDAVVIASQGNEVVFNTQQVFIKRCVSFRDIQKTKGIRSEQQIYTGKIRGFMKFDKVLYDGNEYFIKGRMSTGYAILMNIKGEKQDLKPIPKFNKIKRLSARKSWIIQAETIQKVA